MQRNDSLILDICGMHSQWTPPKPKCRMMMHVIMHSVQIDPLMDLIWKDDNAIKNIFDVVKDSISKYNVEIFWLSLICHGIIDIVVKSDGFAQFKFRRVVDNSSAYQQECYLIDKYWYGINCYPAVRPKGRNHKEVDIELL
jgi:hypothetical protein